MMDDATQGKLDILTVPQFRQILRDIIYSEEHLLKGYLKIILLADPDATPEACEWIKSWVKSHVP